MYSGTALHRLAERTERLSGLDGLAGRLAGVADRAAGWHNVVHLASGLFLLALMGRHDTARIAALSFGAIYGVVTIIGLIDREDVIGWFPVNGADNVLYILLTVAAFAAGLAPLRDRGPARSPRTA